MNVHVNTCDCCGNFASVAMYPVFKTQGVKNTCRLCNRKLYEFRAELDKKWWLNGTQPRRRGAKKTHAR